MDCEQCGAPLDVSATKDNYLRCSPCRLLFIAKEDGTLQPLAVKAPPGFDQAEFFASFTANLGFENDEDDEAPGSGPVAVSGGARTSRAPLLIGLLLVVIAVVAGVVLLGRGAPG